MLNSDEFEQLSLTFNWTREAYELVKRIRSSEPARRVRGGRGNVSGRYPSKKMGRVIQFESHTCELPYVLDLEYYQDNVLEYWDQPITFKIEYENKNNRKVSPMHTPDFFVIRKTHVEFVDCKTEEELIHLANVQPAKYHLGKDGQWRCPPGERAVAQFDYKYRVVSTAEINRTQYRNTIFLEDYLGVNTPHIAKKQIELIVQIVANDPGISLSGLLERTIQTGGNADEVYTLIARGYVYVDLRAEALAHRDHVWVYPDKNFAHQSPNNIFYALEPKGKFLEVKEDTRILWGTSVLTILYSDESKIYLESEKGSNPSLTIAHFEDLVRKGHIQGIRTDKEPDLDLRWKEILNNANQNRIAEALRIQKIVLCSINNEPLPQYVPPRTLARWKSKYLAGKRIYGNGLVGLLPNWRLRGDRKTVRLHTDARTFMMEAIDNEYETMAQKGMFVVWSNVVKWCQENGIEYPSYQTFVHYVKKRPKYLQILKRKGKRAAYAKQPFYHWLEKDTPRHGDRPFEICHIDHTELDIELVDPKTGENLGRPWATFMVDAFSRRILAVYLTYDPPSYRSNMMIVRECVRRHGRLPQIIIVDGGSDLRGNYFETLAAAFEITLKTRPGTEPRYGSVIERLFNTANKQFVHNLIGNTQIARNVRQITKANDPKRLAVWSIGPLYDSLCDWAYNCYDTEEHWTLKQAPRDIYASALRLTGNRQHRLICYDEEFLILTMPTTKKGTAKNSVGRGVKINGEYYWCDGLDKADLEEQSLRVRYEPFNFGIAYVYISNQWVKCRPNNFHELEGRNEREQKATSIEKRQRDRLYFRDMPRRGVARANKNSKDETRQQEQSEKLCLLRKREAENATVIKVINDNCGSNISTQPLFDTVLGEENLVNDFDQTPSLFSDLDLEQLGNLEAYKA